MANGYMYIIQIGFQMAKWIYNPNSIYITIWCIYIYIWCLNPSGDHGKITGCAGAFPAHHWPLIWHPAAHVGSESWGDFTYKFIYKWIHYIYTYGNHL